MVKLIFGRLLEAIINQAIALDPNNYRLLKRHDGKVIKLIITDWNQEFYYIIRPEKIYIYSDYSDQPSTTIKGSSLSLLAQLSPNADISRVDVEGDTDLAQDLQSLINPSNKNWDEYLSYFTGDFVASGVTKWLAEMKKTTKNTQQRTIEDIRDYLQEEKRFLPSSEEVEDFYEDIASLRQRLDRLEARFYRLTEK